MSYIKSSLRKKIIFGYVAGLLIIVLAASFILLNLIFIEERIKFFTVITRFVDTVLEIRRYEKNYFLYRQPDDFQKLTEYIDNALIIVKDNYHDFDLISPLTLNGKNEKTTSEFAIDILLKYKMLIQSTGAGNSFSKTLQELIRKSGHEITELAESLSASERQIIKSTIGSTKRSLVISLMVFATGTFFIGVLVSTLVIKPLKELEQSMNNIASGRFEMLPISSHDQEILSLKSAFERMIREIFSQRDIIRSEKLRSLGTMLAGIAHEVNNPLSNISTSAEILKEEIDSDDREFMKELIEQILDETDRAKEIVKSVLDYTRDRRFEKKPVYLKELISETMRFARTDIPPHITVATDVPDDLMINVDKQKIQHALLNLIRNAIDAMDGLNREGRLEIKAELYDNNRLAIEISDNGVGITEEDQQRIFDPFFTTKDVGKGTGLGLFITHSIIKQHNGDISVKSIKGKGTTFTIKLPKE